MDKIKQENKGAYILKKIRNRYNETMSEMANKLGYSVYYTKGMGYNDKMTEEFYISLIKNYELTEEEIEFFESLINLKYYNEFNSNKRLVYVLKEIRKRNAETIEDMASKLAVSVSYIQNAGYKNRMNEKMYKNLVENYELGENEKEFLKSKIQKEPPHNYSSVLKEIRKRYNESAEDMAIKLGYSTSYIFGNKLTKEFFKRLNEKYKLLDEEKEILKKYIESRYTQDKTKPISVHIQKELKVENNEFHNYLEKIRERNNETIEEMAQKLDYGAYYVQTIASRKEITKEFYERLVKNYSLTSEEKKFFENEISKRYRFIKKMPISPYKNFNLSEIFDRIRKNDTKEEMAKKLGFNTFHIYHLENGQLKFTRNILGKILENYKIDSKDLKKLEEIATKNEKINPFLEVLYQIKEKTGETFSQISKNLGYNEQFIYGIKNGLRQITLEFIENLDFVYSLNDKQKGALIDEFLKNKKKFSINPAKMPNTKKLLIAKFIAKIKTMDENQLKEINKILQ